MTNIEWLESKEKFISSSFALEDVKGGAIGTYKAQVVWTKLTVVITCQDTGIYTRGGLKNLRRDQCFYFHNKEPMELEATQDVVSADTLNYFKRHFINDDEIEILKVA